MELIFLICAIAGGTILACQVVMTIAGLGDEGGMEVDDLPDDGSDHGHADSSWLFGIISFRTIVAALTFFGLAGMASLQSGVQPVISVLLAVAAGAAAMVGVHRMMLLLSQLREDGTFRIHQAVGKRATVYVPIPGEHSGAGKVQLRMHDRIVELKALTGNHEKLATGTRVEVVEIISADTIEVAALEDTEAENEREIA